MNTNITAQFATGQLVKFADPQDADEASARYVVVEYRAARPEIGDTRPDRILVRYVCDLPIAPTDVFDAEELVLA